MGHDGEIGSKSGLIESWRGSSGSLVVLRPLAADGIGSEFGDTCKRKDVDRAGGVRTSGNGDDSGSRVRQERGADKYTHAVVDRRDREVHHVDPVVSAAVVVRTGGGVVGVGGNAAVDNKEIVDCRSDRGSAIPGSR